MFQANWDYVDEAPYKELYSDPEYRARCSRKMRRMRRMARTASLAFVEDRRFCREQFRLREVYPDGGRGHLFDFIGLWSFFIGSAPRTRLERFLSNKESFARAPGANYSTQEY